MHILPAVDRKGKNEEEGGGKKRTLKQDREVKRKAMAGKEFNWAMLYMNVRTATINIYFSSSSIALRPERRCGLVYRRPHERVQGRHPQPRV